MVNKGLVKLNDTHEMLAELRAAGWTVERCIKHLGVSKGMFRRCTATEEWQDLLAEKRRKFVKRVAEEQLNDPVRAKVKEVVPVAVDRAKKILNQGEDSDANKTIRTILTVGAGGDEKQGGNKQGVQINITNNQADDLSEMEERMAEREKNAREIGVRKDRGTIDVSEVSESD